MFNIVPYARWTLVIIDDPTCLPGKSIYDVIQLLFTVVKFKFVILDDIEGCGRDWLISSFKEKENTITKIEDLNRNSAKQCICRSYQSLSLFCIEPISLKKLKV
jgi:hypothetical protein